jgi:hypothetical protein
MHSRDKQALIRELFRIFRIGEEIGLESPCHSSKERGESMEVQAAAISLQGVNFVVVLVGMDLVTNAGEGDMAIESLQPRFGGVPVILMSQREDSSPVYYGDESIVRSLRDIPVDEMPWKEYPV